MHSKKGFGEIIILVFSIFLAILMGVVMIVILRDLQDLTPVRMQHASGDAVYSKIFYTYLALPEEDPRGLQLAAHLRNNDREKVKSMLHEFVVKHVHPGACWEFHPLLIKENPGTCRLDDHIPFQSLKIEVDLPVGTKQTYTLRVT